MAFSSALNLPAGPALGFAPGSWVP